jgi:lipopolysaccharide export system permease protein
MRILDWYLLKRYLVSFFFTLLIFIPIAIAIDVSEKIDKFISSGLSFFEVVDQYYISFVIYYSNTFLPLALFISVIMFTSKLAGNTEIVAINSSQISFTRFLLPYFIGSAMIFVYALGMNHYIVPKSQKQFLKFEKDYIKTKIKQKENTLKHISLQLDDNNFVYIRRFDFKRGTGYNFSYETHDGLNLTYKLTAANISYKPQDSAYRLSRYTLRKINPDGTDYIETGSKLDTMFNFTNEDLQFSESKAKEMTTPEVNSYIETATARGVKNLNIYYVERYKRTSLPVSAFILTLIAVCLASRKKRGGLGVNLAIGITLMFTYVFLMKVGEVLGSVAGSNALLLVWLPNIVFGILSIFLYYRAKS